MKIVGETVGIEGLGLFYSSEARKLYERRWFTWKFFRAPKEHRVDFLPYPALLSSIIFDKE